ncbi:histone-lysine N-methyltransferase, H3 lysine-79 specific-like [Mytilus californianus]|uniref:histone-lysine N-methyltransferase, H3 lysine-79 specific-like n=1 Tax=Mytilus californianus TaxID=6549 RepID=UPI002246821C|nr:histone-lysine N-methyltransferase, H3 lysine-79 specific-like [Mytilus californianus]
MGNAVDILYRKKIEERKKQTEKERQIFQACIAWNIRQEELHKREIAERKEKAWKEQEKERMKKDEELMEMYVQNIEKEKISNKKKLKLRERKIEERKRLSSSLSNRSTRQMEEHIKKESKIIAKNIENIEKRAEKSKEETKKRIKTIEKKHAEDRKLFMRRVTTAEQERNKDIVKAERRISYIEKKIVQERMIWQHKLLAARRIESGKKVSGKKLWEIGRKTVEKKKQSLEKSKQGEGNKVYKSQRKVEVEWENKTYLSGKDQLHKNMNKKAINNRVVKTILSTVNEEDPILLDVGKKKITPRIGAKKQRITKPVVKSEQFTSQTDIVRRSNSERFQRFYVPQKNNYAVKQTTLNTFRKTDTDVSTTFHLNKVDSVTNKAEFGKTQQNTETQRQKSSNNTNNLRKDNRINNHSDQNTSMKQTKNPKVEFEQKSEATKIEDIAEKPTKLNENPIQMYNHAVRTNNSRRTDTSKPGQIKPNLTQTPTGNFNSLNRLQERKQIITLSDPLIPKSLELRQPEVEEIMGIKPLSIAKDSITNKTVHFENKFTESKQSLTTGIEPKSDKYNEENAKFNNQCSKMKEGQILKSNDQKERYEFLFSTVKKPKRTGDDETESKNKEKTDKKTTNDYVPNLPTTKNVLLVDKTQVKPPEMGTGAVNTKVSLKTRIKELENDTKTEHRFGKSAEVEEGFRNPNTKEDPKTTTVEQITRVTLQNNEMENVKRSTIEDRRERRQKLTVPIKPRTNLSVNSYPSMFLVDQRISEVQRRIDKMMKTSSTDISVA